MDRGPSPYGYCKCGCGEKTVVSRFNDKTYGWRKGEPRDFRKGHSGRKAVRWVVEDAGHDTPCWIWQLAKTKGYGVVRHERVMQQAHVVEWEKVNGKKPQGMHLDHLCRNRACVNPDHLECVTPAINTRRASGTKLTLADAHVIREWAGKWSYSELAESFGVSTTAIGHVVKGRTWNAAA